MKRYIRQYLNRVNQRGFTLIEVTVATAITAVLTVGIGLFISQISQYYAGSSGRMQAIKQVEITVDKIRLDVQMAQQINIKSTGQTPDINVNYSLADLNLIWTDWSNNVNTVDYSLAGSQLSRSFNKVLNGATIENTQIPVSANTLSVVAQKLSSGNWSITITVSVNGYRSATESRTFEVQPRTGY